MEKILALYRHNQEYDDEGSVYGFLKVVNNIIYVVFDLSVATIFKSKNSIEKWKKTIKKISPEDNYSFEEIDA